MGGIPLVSEALEIGMNLVIQIGQWLKDLMQWIVRTFKWDNPFHLFTLALLFFFLMVAFLALMVGVNSALGAGEGGTPRDILVGEGSVMSGVGKDGSMFDKIGGETGKVQVGPGSDSDIDGDGIPNAQDSDMDGDGIPNNQDYDVDGDGQPNDADMSPCGGVVCGTYPSLCGNHVCDNFKTPAKWAVLDVLLQGCSDLNVYYEIPDYCLNGVLPTTIPVMRGNVSEYVRAYCGTSNVMSSLNSRCFLNEATQEIWYHETFTTCPTDCNDTLLCMKDITCDRVDNCDTVYGTCCSSGTAQLAGKCTFDAISGSALTAICWGADTTQVRGGSRPIDELRSVPFHCECASDSDCSGDYGGISCCGVGTYYEGLCYDQCDILEPE
jgi:hypothetical protein